MSIGPKRIIPLPEGWKERTLYLVDVSYRPSNPIHRSVFYTGFLHNGNPCGYNEVHAPGMKGHVDLNEVYYMVVIKEICSEKDLHPKPLGLLPPPILTK